MTDPLVVVSFNLRNGIAFDGCNSWPFRRRAAAGVVRSIDADVVGLQEAYRFQLRYLLRRLPDYVAVGSPRSRWGERTPVLVRGRVLSHSTRWFEVTGARFPRVATTARLAVRGQELTFTSTHLDERSGERRRASLEQLVSWLAAEDGPHVIAGDFNATLDDPMFDALTGFKSALPADAGGTSHHFRGHTDGRQIDHIFVPRTAAIIDARVDTTRVASDHWPVVATVRL